MECACLPWISARNVNRDSHKYFDFAVRHQLSWPRHLRLAREYYVRELEINFLEIREREKIWRLIERDEIIKVIKGEAFQVWTEHRVNRLWTCALESRDRPVGYVCTHWLWSTRARGNVASTPIGRKHLYSSRRGAACVYDNRLW